MEQVTLDHVGTPVARDADGHAPRFLPQHIPELDVLRGVAILIVMLHHLHPRVFHWGWFGVDLFFVLSGFLITRILLASQDDPQYYRNFFIRRTLRIFPLYFNTLLVFLAYQMFRAKGELPENFGWLFVYATSFVTLYARPNTLGDFTHFWSLAVEEHFYVAWPFIVRHARSLTRVCILLIVLAMTCRVVMWMAEFKPVAIYKCTLTRMDTLAIGAIVAILERRNGGLHGRLLRGAIWAMPVLGLVLGVVLWCDGGFRRRQVFLQLFGYTIMPLIFAAVLIIAGGIKAGGRWQLLTRFRPLMLLGLYSYGIYVLHRPLMPWAGRILPRQFFFGWVESAGLREACFLAAQIAIFAAIGALSYHVFETPFLRLKRRFAAKATS